MLTQPISEGADLPDHSQPDQFMLDTLRTFVEASGKAMAVPLRYDLSADPATLKQTLDSLDGVLFTGGMLSIKSKKDMPPKAQLYCNTALAALKYTMEYKLPLFALCQGYQLINLLLVEQSESMQSTDDQKA